MASWLLLALLACGGRDVTTLTSEGEAAEDPGADDSRLFAVLVRPESLDAVCRVIGVSVAGGGPDCAGVVESCREGLGAALLDRAAPPLPSGDLAPLFNCPLTVEQRAKKPPVSHAEFVAAFRTWVASGGACP